MVTIAGCGHRVNLDRIQFVGEVALSVMEKHRLFINYRTADTGETASALYRDLREHLGGRSVFIDHDRIEGGEEWPRRLQNEVELATAMLCLIGEDFLAARGPGFAQRQLDVPGDWVRREICRALERGITVMPILVENASLPEARALPEDMSEIVDLQARRLRRVEWDNDLARILQDLGCGECLGRSSDVSGGRPPAATTSFSFWQRGVRRYLKDLGTKMRERNSTWAAGTHEPYVDLAAEQREDQSARWREYPRERGYVISFPQIRPAVAEVAAVSGALESVTTASDVVGLQTRTVRSVFKVLRSHLDPIVLLGEPGSGKSTTLRELAIQLAQRALRIPGAPIPIYIELGTFRHRIDLDPNAAILDLIRDAVPPGASGLRRHLGPGEITVPIVVLFDAMDEMPRFGDYTERTAALAAFASDYALVARSVFACRTNDFDPSFGHRQLVLKPFDERRIRLFLRKTLGSRFEVGGEPQAPKSAARRLMRADELGAEAGNPLTLSLAVSFIGKRRNWPRGRSSLFEDHIVALADKAYRRNDDRPRDEQLRSTVDAWAGLAYEIFRRDGAVFMDRVTLVNRVGARSVELAIGGGLVVEDAESGLLKFRHHRLQEFLVARRLRLPDPPQPQWSAMLVSPRWQETLLNYFALGGRNDAVFGVVLETLSPAERYFTRLRPLVDRTQARVDEAQRAYDAIEPDEARSTGEGVYYVYSAQQKARKDAAGKRLGSFRRRNKRLTTLPPERETAWSDHVHFAARLSALIKRSRPEAAGLRQLLRGVLTGLLDFGRPVAQVRMLSAWREMSAWCPSSVLDPVRDSTLNWVRSQAIHVLVTTALRRDRVDHAFSEELEWETLNLRLPGKLPIFWETAALRPGRRLKLAFGMLIHLHFILMVLLAVAGTGALVISQVSQSIPAVADVAPALRWMTWVALVGVATVLTVPALPWHPFVRVAAANAIVGGIALSALSFSKMLGDSGASEGAWADSLAALSIVGRAAAPAMVTSVALISLVLGARFAFRIVTSEPRPSLGSPRGVKTTEGYVGAWQTGRAACFVVAAGGIFVFLTSPAGDAFFSVVIVIFGLILAALVVSGLGLLLADRWKAHEVRSAPIRITLFLGEILGLVGIVVIVIGILVGFSNLLSLLGVLVDALVPDWFGELLARIFIGLLLLVLGAALLYGIVAYAGGAFGQTFSELRYLLLRRHFRRRPYSGDLVEWEAAFRQAPEVRRRELLESLDHRAMGVAPRDALNALYDLETLVEIDQPAADVFYKTMHRLQEAIRQQRWANPGG